MALKFYYDMLSPPSRSLYILLKLTNIPFQACAVNLLKGEQLSEEYKQKCSKFQKVPVIHDKDFRLTQSSGILRYLTREYPIDECWYPKDSKIRARVDEFLEWQHLNTRLNCVTFFRNKWIIPYKTGVKPSEQTTSKDKSAVLKTLKEFEDFFLKDDPFIAGKEMTFSDISAACDIEQTRFGGYDARNDFPRIKNWIEVVKNECNPYYDEAHDCLYKVEKTIEKD
ncbi:hypothetical protein JTB14_018679 [Gonioctena quinquepunctata]|nr:hypothetical protein JTB14_018679 [Gonioctena quinquepunctata]